MIKKYLVTGGEGFIGSSILKISDAISYDLKSGLDILNFQNIKNYSSEVAGIFHCAALISVVESTSEPTKYFKTNIEGTYNIVRIAEENNLKIVFSSSSSTYGELNIPAKESISLNPKSPYAENKMLGEKMLQNSKLPHIALRYFNVYGPGQSPQYAGVITSFISNALKNKDLIIYGNGSQVRDFIFVDDVARANILAMKLNNKVFEVFNIGTGKEITIKNLAKLIIKLTNSKSKIVYKPKRPGDINYSKANISKATKNLNWKPKVSLEEGLEKTISYYKN